MTTFDMTGVAVALPQISDELSLRPDFAEWLILAYAGTMIALGLPAGRYVDQADVRGCFIVSALGFAVASAIGGLAPNFEVLIAARLAQGAFAALVVAVVPVIAARALPISQRGRALSIIGTLGPLGAVSGPALGGPLVDLFGWRSIFFIVVPFSIGAVFLATRTLNQLTAMPVPRLNLGVESAVVGASVLSLFAALTLLAHPNRPVAIIIGLLLASAAFVYLWTRLAGFEAFRGAIREPLVAATVTSLALATVASGALYFLPPFALGLFHGWSLTQIGLVLLFQPLAMGLVGPLAGVLVDKWSARLTGIIGLGFMTLGATLLVFTIENSGMVVIVGCLLLTGLGLGLFAGPNQTLLMNGAPPALRGTAAAASGLARQFGIASGAAVATIIWLGVGSGETSSEGLVPAFVVAPVAAVLALLAFAGLSRRRGSSSMAPGSGDPGGPAGPPAGPPPPQEHQASEQQPHAKPLA
jgi:MFS family permease